MKIETTHHIDAGEKDSNGLYDFYYEYELIHFLEGDTTIVARSYSAEHGEAHFLSIIEKGQRRILTDSDFLSPLLGQAIDYLRQVGKFSLQLLRTNGHEPIPPAA